MIKNKEKSIFLKTFIVHQKILYKKLITTMHVKNHFKKVHKLKSLKIQKFILKKMMIFFEFLLNSTLIMSLCEILYIVASSALT